MGRNKTIAVIDVGSGHVGCALMILSGESTRVISSARSKLILEPRDEGHAQARLKEEIAEAIQGATARAPGTHVSEVYVTLHAPWAISQLVSASATSATDHETVIRHAHLAKLADNALAAAPEIDRSKLFETSAVSVRLNGYPTEDPEGKRAREIDFFAIASTVEPALRTTVEGALHGGLPAATIFWRSAARVFASMLPRIHVPPEAVIVDFGVQATSLMLHKDGLLSREQHTAEGLQSVLTRVHGARPPEELLSLFRMLGRDACADDTCLQLQNTLNVAEPELVKAFGETFAQLADAKRLPQDLVLITHPDIAPWLQHFFERIDFTQFTLTAMPFATRVITDEDIAPWIPAGSGLDAPLALSSAAALIEMQST